LLDIYRDRNFSIPLATDADVTAVEENPYAITDGKRNVEINNISNCRFINSSAENFNTKDNFDITILDPPRGGIANKLMERILSINLKLFISLQSNSRRDQKIAERYNLESIRLIDSSQTFHIESPNSNSGRISPSPFTPTTPPYSYSSPLLSSDLPSFRQFKQ
jgi:23S rRNA (uracil1939-C5)-methyltransferase